jgi:hypothetical protein
MYVCIYIYTCVLIYICTNITILHISSSHHWLLQVIKICSTCEEEMTKLWEINTNVHAHFFTYCGETIYGDYAPQSALVFVPIDRNTSEIVSQVRLRTFLSLNRATGDTEQTPTIAWPTSFDSYQKSAAAGSVSADDFQNMMADYLPGLVAACSGSVAIFPDYLGYGDSQLEYNRTMFWPEMYMQASLVPFMRLQRYIANITNACTVLDERITIRGTDDGAFAVAAVSDAFRRYGVQTLSSFVGAGPLDLETFLMDSVAAYGENSVERDNPIRVMLPATVFAYSADVKGMANANTSQQLVSSTFRDNLIFWMQSPEPLSSVQIATLTPSDGRILINEGFLASMESALAKKANSTCLSGNDKNNAKLCEAILKASAWHFLYNASYQLVFPVSICYSEDDEVFSSRHYPADMFNHPRISKYEGPSGYAELGPAGNHSRTRQVCAIDPILFYNLEGHMPSVIEDRPNYMFPLTISEQAACLNKGTTDGVASDPSAESTTDGTSGSSSETASGGSVSISTTSADVTKSSTSRIELSSLASITVVATVATLLAL